MSYIFYAQTHTQRCFMRRCEAYSNPRPQPDPGCLPTLKQKSQQWPHKATKMMCNAQLCITMKSTVCFCTMSILPVVHTLIPAPLLFSVCLGWVRRSSNFVSHPPEHYSTLVPASFLFKLSSSKYFKKDLYSSLTESKQPSIKSLYFKKAH